MVPAASSIPYPSAELTDICNRSFPLEPRKYYAKRTKPSSRVIRGPRMSRADAPPNVRGRFVQLVWMDFTQLHNW